MEYLLYDNIRRNLFVILRIYGEIGNTELSVDLSKKDIFRAVQVFLKDSNKFG
jgi:hypothetical protein